jgi:hypothetical protein
MGLLIDYPNLRSGKIIAEKVVPSSRTISLQASVTFRAYFRSPYIEQMLLRPELIDRLAEVLEGIAMPVSEHTHGAGHIAGSNERSSIVRREASVLIYHTGRSDGAASAPRSGESPLLEINLIESDEDVSVLVASALGMVELHGIDEIRLLETTEEAAFYSRKIPGRLSVLTLSSNGVLQVYMNIDETLAGLELSEIADADLRAAVALKIFSENAEIFSDSLA